MPRMLLHILKSRHSSRSMALQLSADHYSLQSTAGTHPEAATKFLLTQLKSMAAPLGPGNLSCVRIPFNPYLFHTPAQLSFQDIIDFLRYRCSHGSF